MSRLYAARLDFISANFPGAITFLATGACRTAPPGCAIVQVLQLDGPGHGICLLPLGYEVLPEPDIPRRFPLLEKQQVRPNRGIGPEDRVRQAHDGVKVAFLHQVFLEPGLDALSEQRAVGKDHGGPAARFEKPDDQGEEQVRRFARPEMLREIGLDAVFFLSAEGRIGQYDIHALVPAPGDVRTCERVVMTKEGRVLDAVQQHVRDREHVGKRLLLHCSERSLHPGLVLRTLYIALAHVPDGAGEEAAGTAGRIEQRLAGFRVDHPRHEGGHGARRVVFARVAGRLQVIQDLLVDVAEVLAFGQIVEVDSVNLVDDLPHQLSRLHVVVGILEHIAHDVGPGTAPGRKPLELRKEIAVDEGEEFLASYAFRVGGPLSPLQVGGDGRAVVFAELLKFLILIVDDLEEEHPAELTDSLGVPIDAHILTHDVLNRLDECTYGHAQAVSL